MRPLEDLDSIEDADLAELYAYPADLDRPWVRANVVTTLDGAASGADGSSGSINSSADLRVFALLRSLSDVVVVGAGTARAEGYRPVRTREVWRNLRTAMGLTPAPTLALVTRSLDLPEGALEDVEGGGPVLVVTSWAADHDRVRAARDALGDTAVVQAGEDEVDLADAVAQLGGRGLSRVLCEGGPRLLGAIVAAGLLDELCLTVSPLLVSGTSSRVLLGAAADVRLRLGHVIESDGTLLTRWLND